MSSPVRPTAPEASRDRCHHISRIGLLLAAAILLVMAPARVQAQVCPLAPITQTVSGQSTTAQSRTYTFAGISPYIPLAPCETVVVRLDGSAGGPNMGLYLKNADHQVLDQTTFVCGSSCSYEVPAVASLVAYPYPGTRGTGGLPAEVEVWVGYGNSQPSVTFTLTITRIPRQGYNTGGIGFSDAPLIDPGVTQYGSVHPNEPGQFYKVHLNAGQSMYVTGQVTGATMYQPWFGIQLFNASQGSLLYLVSMLAGGTKVFPAQDTNPTIYTNSGAAADFYLKVWSAYNLVQDFQFRVESPRLTLFLDADGNFDPSNPVSDIDTYVPGSRLSDGVSVALPQQLTLIAAYVDSTNHIVTPLATGSVAFSLSDTSAFKGIAMNASLPSDNPDDPDFRLGSLSASFGTDKTARVSLYCWDYGGFTTASANQSAQLHIPKDEDGNWIADAGWMAEGSHVAYGGLAGDDLDAGPGGNPSQGDGLAAFEEYRGFFVLGVHTRTDPFRQDLFLQSNLGESVGDAPALQISVLNLVPTEVNASNEISFNYTNSGFGGNVSPHYAQKALQIGDGGYSSTDSGVTQPIVLGPIVPKNVAYILVYTQSIRSSSPPTNNTTTADSVDIPKTDQTIAHEVGHGVTLDHIDVHWVCFPPVFTVMVTHYFAPSNGFDE